MDPGMEGLLTKIRHVAVNLLPILDFENPDNKTELSIKLAFKQYLKRLFRCQFLEYITEFETLDLVILEDVSYDPLMSKIGSDGNPIRETVFVDWEVKEAEFMAKFRAAVNIEQVDVVRKQWNYRYSPRTLRLVKEAAAEFLSEDEDEDEDEGDKYMNKPNIINLVMRGS
jgi:hypothetical protein